MTHLVVLGIDGLDREFIDRNLGALPNFARLRQSGHHRPIRSVFPPDSDTAWASLYTGLDPAKHGVFSFSDALSKEFRYVQSDGDAAAIRGRTLWDEASRAGLRVCVQHPHLGFPPWPVNGIMVGRSAVSDEVLCEGDGALLRGFDLQRVRLPRGFPDYTDLDPYVDGHLALVEAQAELFHVLADAGPWDLQFAYSSSVDMAKHKLWAYTDEEDPQYPGSTRWKDSILRIYQAHDRWLAQVMNRLPEQGVLVVLGDHGHGRRPHRVAYLNEVLRRQGLLKPKSGWRSPVRRVVQAAKGPLFRAISRFHLENLALRVAKRVPAAKSAVAGGPALDAATVAYMADQSGIKPYSYGGIRISPRLGPGERERAEAQVLEALRALRHPEEDRPLVQWAALAREVYSGPHLDRYPEVLYLLDRGFGGAPDLRRGLFGVSASQAVNPGTHHVETAEFDVLNARADGLPGQVPDMMDIGASLRHLLGLPAPADGRPFLGAP